MVNAGLMHGVMRGSHPLTAMRRCSVHSRAVLGGIPRHRVIVSLMFALKHASQVAQADLSELVFIEVDHPLDESVRDA
jgi:hypothetical protein